MPWGEDPPGLGPSADHHHSGRSGRNWRTRDIVDKAPVTFLAKNSVHTGVVADDDVVIGCGDTSPGFSAYAHMIAGGFAVHKRQITDGRVVVSAGVCSKRFRTDRRVGTAGGIVHERKIAGGSVGRTTVVKDKRISSNGGVV